MRQQSDRSSQMPPHNLLVHVVGRVDHGCPACDWLRDRADRLDAAGGAE